VPAYSFHRAPSGQKRITQRTVLPPPVKAAARAGGLKRKKGEARHDRCCARKGKPKAVKGRGRKSVIAERRSFKNREKAGRPAGEAGKAADKRQGLLLEGRNLLRNRKSEYSALYDKHEIDGCSLRSCAFFCRAEGFLKICSSAGRQRAGTMLKVPPSHVETAVFVFS
jgi:hypothetical protein